MEELEDDFLFKTDNTFLALREEKMKENRLFKMLKNSKVNYTKQMSIEDVVNPFVLNAPFLQGFLMFSGGREMVHWEKMG